MTRYDLDELIYGGTERLDNCDDCIADIAKNERNDKHGI